MCEKSCTACDACRTKNAEKASVTINKSTFTDSVTISEGGDKLVSVRDGVVDYLGKEIGHPDFYKSFKVYRSPETVRQIADQIVGVPITRDHVDIDLAPTNIIGEITGSEVVEWIDSETLTTLAVENTFSINDSEDINGNHVSIGFRADLVKADPSEPYDFIQENMVIHHVAKLGDEVNGRCGSICTFKDEESMKFKFKFADEEGSMNLEELSQLIHELPSAIADMDVEKAKAFLISLKKLYDEVLADREDVKKEIEVEEVVESADEAPESEKVDSTDSEIEEEEFVDEDLSEDEKEIVKVTGADSRANLDSITSFIDSRVQLAAKDHAMAVAKGREFLSESYSFADKSANQIKRDAIATMRTEKFADGVQLDTAFLMLEKKSAYANFSDAGIDDVDVLHELKDQEY